MMLPRVYPGHKSSIILDVNADVGDTCQNVHSIFNAASNILYIHILSKCNSDHKLRSTSDSMLIIRAIEFGIKTAKNNLDRSVKYD